MVQITVMERPGYGNAPYHGTPFEYVAVADRVYGLPLVYHFYLPNGAAWNWQTRCGRDLACHYEKSRAVSEGARPCKQCYPKGR